MGVAKTDRFGVLRLGRRTALKMMVLTIAGLMSLGAVTPAYADEPPASFWTQFTPSTDTRLIFVSSSEGHDANSGLTPAQPVKTLAKAESLLRDGFPDWMLLKRGDVWETGLPSWSKSGRSTDEMMVVGAYGAEPLRPQLRPIGREQAIKAYGSTETKHVAFVGLHLEPRNRADSEDPSGIIWRRRSKDILLEDLYIAGFKDNVEVQSLGGAFVVRDFRVNGCVIVDAWSKQSHAQGIFADNVEGLIVENSVVASNGFSVERAANPTIFNHNIYVQHGTLDVVVRNNIIADASSHGLQLRPGGVIENNLFISNPLNIWISATEGMSQDGIVNSVSRNVIMYGRDISAALPRGSGIDIANLQGGRVTDNILFASPHGPNCVALMISPDRGIRDVMVAGNWIVGWNGPVIFKSPSTPAYMNNLSFVNNNVVRVADDSSKPLIAIDDIGDSLRFSGNHYRVTGLFESPFRIGGVSTGAHGWATSVEPDATYDRVMSELPDIEIETYLIFAGRSGGVGEFLAAAKLQSRSSYDPTISPGSVYSWMLDRLQD